jgi:hypothetical protein
LGLFRIFRPSWTRPRQAKLALFCTIGIGLEWWNDGILEQWGLPKAATADTASVPRFGQLGLFGAIGSSHGLACPSGGGKLGLFVGDP